MKIALVLLTAVLSTANAQTLPQKKGVTPPPVRKPPAPPTGATPKNYDGHPSLEGVWVLSGSPNLPGDPDYKPAAKTLYDARKAAKGANDPESFCLPDGLVRMTPYPYKIVQAGPMVILLSEGNTHSYRRMFTDGRPHNLDLDPNTYTGDSIAHWEGDVLVVDSIGFNDKTWLDGTGKPHSEDLHVTERYRRPDLGHLTIDYTLEDKIDFNKPYTFQRTFTLAPGWELQEYVCQAILDGIKQ